jgi:CubicO group peptidase (beta-lactamase class C family)
MVRLLILLLLSTFAFGQENDSLRLEKYIDAFSFVNEFSGTILVVKDNRPVILKACGFADAEKKIPNLVDTRFRIGSCTKQFTAIAILQLQEQGKLSVSDKLSKYFPKIPKSDSITIDMLLTHRSGVHDYANDNRFKKSTIRNLQDKR